MISGTSPQASPFRQFGFLLFVKPVLHFAEQDQRLPRRSLLRLALGLALAAPDDVGIQPGLDGKHLVVIGSFRAGEDVFEDGEEVTGIESVLAVETETKAATVFYNLAGQVVGKDYKGIVIGNDGKKYVK